MTKTGPKILAGVVQSKTITDIVADAIADPNNELTDFLGPYKTAQQRAVKQEFVASRDPHMGFMLRPADAPTGEGVGSVLGGNRAEEDRIAREIAARARGLVVVVGSLFPTRIKGRSKRGWVAPPP